ncbi:hypothetical protein SDC9_201151 [bioreactor metagenome]|uniref:PqqD family protein n=1 Tax=bioreactor metagenome TaxID=1076179 RepID=A0A645IQH4_9ZZZZ
MSLLEQAWQLPVVESESVPQPYARVPKRLYVTPVNKPDDYMGLSLSNKEAYLHYVKTVRAHLAGAHRLEALIQFHINGEDTIWEIARKVRLQSASCEVAHVAAYVDMLEAFGLVAY